jgi:hypothetical protein
LKRIVFILLLVPLQFFGQAERIIDFYPLQFTDSISGSDRNVLLSQVDSLKSDDYFFSDNYQGQEGLFWIKKAGNKWVVFDFELDLNFGPNTFVSGFKNENERFVSIQTYRSPSGQCLSKYGRIILLDIVNDKSISFFNYSQIACFDTMGEVTSSSECASTFQIRDGFIEIESTQEGDDRMWCMDNAEFKIEENAIVQTKYYSESAHKLIPLICIGDICTGMSQTVLKDLFPQGTFRQVPLYTYGYDSENLGIEISEKEQVQMFVTVSKDIITAISIVSADYKLNTISTELTFSQVLEMFPRLELHID